MPRTDMEEDFTGRSICNDRFLLLHRLGGGRFGVVYRAEERAFGRPLREVAIKLTRRAYLDKEKAADHLQEAFTLATIAQRCRWQGSRKHLVQVFGLGICEELSNRGYLVMEFVPGVPLLEHVRTLGGAVPMSMARRYFWQLCNALAPCHGLRRPIVHGDLKSDNILVDETGTLRVADFGSARSINPSVGFSGDAVGALIYAAPEALLGKAEVRSDIYSLGLVMYELLTGGGPHLDMPQPTSLLRAVQFALQKKELVFPPIAEKCSSLDHDLALFALIEKCCRPIPNDRPDSVETILSELDEIMRDLPVGTRGPGTTNRRAPASRPATKIASTSCRTPRLQSDERSAPDWHVLAGTYLRNQDFVGGLHFLESLDCEQLGLTYRAYLSIFRAYAGHPREALRIGGEVFEEARDSNQLPPYLREALRRALAHGAEELGDPVADYYETTS